MVAGKKTKAKMSKAPTKKAARKPAKKIARRQKKRSFPKRNINSPRVLVQNKISPETFELPMRKDEGAKRWQESKAAALHHEYARPLEVPQIPPEEKPKAAGMPHLATSALAALLISALAFAFFYFVMNFETLYALFVAVPVFVAFFIMINGMLEGRKG